MRGEERTRPIRRATDADEYRRRSLGRPPTLDVSRIGGPILLVIPGKGDAYLDLANKWTCTSTTRSVIPSSNTYPFSAYVDTVLSYGAGAKNTQLTSQLWYKDTADNKDATIVDGGNTGLVERRMYIAESRIVEMMGRLHVDLFLQDRFLLNGVSVNIRLAHSKYAFSLMIGRQNPDYKVQIVDAVLLARKAVLSPTVQMAHIKALEKGTAKYPIRPVDCNVSSIPQGAMSHTHEEEEEELY